jgi:glycosyltransferase involved in cell wall biosynthesis
VAKIRVLQLISGIAIGAESGGAELHAIRIAELLDPARYESALFSVWRHNSEPEVVWSRRLQEMRLPVYGMLPADRGLRQAAQALSLTAKQWRPHIIHSHSERTDTLNLLNRRLRAGDARAIRSVHIDARWLSRPYIAPLMEKLLLPRFLDYQVAVSRNIFDLLLSQGGVERKTGLCYNGIDEKAFSSEFAGSQRLLQPLPGEPPYIGIVGRLTRQKGHDLLLDALRPVLAERPGSLLVIGDGPLEGELRTRAQRLGLGGRVHFLGARPDVWAVLPHLALFALPSRWEGFPTVILEAMAQRVPVIASDVTGSRELVQDGLTGLLVPVEDVDALAAAITRLLQERQLAQQMAERAFQQASSYTIQNMVRCYASIYESLIPSPT